MNIHNSNKGDVNQDKEGTNFEIPLEGSLGLLALGAVGIKAWFQKRKEVKQQRSKK